MNPRTYTLNDLKKVRTIIQDKISQKETIDNVILG